MYSARATKLFDKLIYVGDILLHKTESLDAQANLLLYCGKRGVAVDSDLDFCVVKINHFVFYDIM